MDVYEATIKRLEFVFSEFDNVYVAFSGGKDSGVLINICMDFLRENYPGRKLPIMHKDYEGSYEYTQQYVEETLTGNEDILEVYWLCMPVKLECGVSMYDSHWIPWHPEQKDIWVRDMPEHDCVINIDNHEFDFYRFGMHTSEVNEHFGTWLHKRNGAKKTIGLLGMRTAESLNRWRAVNMRKPKAYKKRNWTKYMDENVYTGYPIYDWSTEDVWRGNYKFNWTYNKLYDLYYQAGLSIHDMRVASAFIDEGVGSLKLHQAIEPNIWSRLVGRVNGANFGAIYGGTKATGFKNISLPEGHTWKTYCEFLLKTLPKQSRELYERKFENSFKVWLGKGGVLMEEEAENLVKAGYDCEIMGPPTKNIKYSGPRQVVRFNTYPDDVGLEIGNFKEIPSYKRMCVTILKNDTMCQYMGYAQTKYERELRLTAIKNYENAI